MQTLTGKRSVPVKYQNGLTEDIEVRALPIRLMPQYMSAYANNAEAEMIQLFTDKKLEWSDALTPESVQAVLAAGEEVNRDFLAAYAGRVLTRTKYLASLSSDKTAEAKKES